MTPPVIPQVGLYDALNFAPVAITPDALIEAARHFLGLPYAPGAAVSWGESADGAPLGLCDCAGLPVLALRRLLLLPQDFDCDFPYRLWRAARAEVKREMLLRNFEAVPREYSRAGDLLFFDEALADGAPDGEMMGARHCAILTARADASSAMIHAINDPGSWTGCVRERAMDAHDWSLVMRRVWRLRNFAL